jgi:hypothetical protein
MGLRYFYKILFRTLFAFLRTESIASSIKNVIHTVRLTAQGFAVKEYISSPRHLY